MVCSLFLASTVLLLSISRFCTRWLTHWGPLPSHIFNNKGSTDIMICSCFCAFSVEVISPFIWLLFCNFTNFFSNIPVTIKAEIKSNAVKTIQWGLKKPVQSVQSISYNFLGSSDLKGFSVNCSNSEIGRNCHGWFSEGLCSMKAKRGTRY